MSNWETGLRKIWKVERVQSKRKHTWKFWRNFHAYKVSDNLCILKMQRGHCNVDNPYKNWDSTTWRKVQTKRDLHAYKPCDNLCIFKMQRGHCHCNVVNSCKNWNSTTWRKYVIFVSTNLDTNFVPWHLKCNDVKPYKNWNSTTHYVRESTYKRRFWCDFHAYKPYDKFCILKYNVITASNEVSDFLQKPKLYWTLVFLKKNRNL